jgi:hypothetical protein
MTKIPNSLIENVKAKNIVLFLGSGFAYSALHPLNSKPPLGNELSKMLSENFLGGSYNSEPLNFVSEMAISENSLFKVQSFIADVFEPFSPSDNQFLYTTFPWKAIFTTNYDLILEKAYQKNKTPLQELSKVFRNTPEYQIFKSPKAVPYYKLHGCISYINDVDVPLILTTDQYINHKKNRERLFSKLFELAMDYSILFIGYSNQDQNIRTILKEIESLHDGRPRSYMVSPNFRDDEIRFWESKKITALKMGHEDFIKQLDNEISENEKVLSGFKVEQDKVIYNKFVVNVKDLNPTSSLLNFLDNESQYVHNSIAATDTNPEAFYKGLFHNWDPIIKNLDIERNEKDRILTQIILDEKYQNPEKPYFFLLKGHAGSGKSVLLKRIAWEASVDFNKLSLFINPNSLLRYNPIFELYNYVKERIYIYIDNAAENEHAILTLIEKAYKEKVPITVVGSERTNIWNEDIKLKSYVTEDFSITYLTPKEIDNLIVKLEQHNSLGFLENKTKEERKLELSEKAGRVLLVALYEATGGKTFEEIIFDEYEQIKSEQAKFLYLTVAILHRLGSEARAGLISRVHGINFHEFKTKLYKPLEYIVFDEKNHFINDYVYKTRHQYIAEIIFETVLTNEQDRYDAYVNILTYLDIDYQSDLHAFFAMTNAKKLNTIFRDPIRINNLYNLAEKKSIDDPKLLQQKAIYQMISRGGNLNLAERYLSKAHELTPNDTTISHSLAEVSYKRAELANNLLERNQYLNHAKKLCEEILKKNKEEPYSYHTLLKISLIKLREVLHDGDFMAIESKIKDIEKLVSAARQLFPEKEFILEIESKFNQIIENEPKAIELLEKAFNVNKASPYIALRYAKFLQSKDELQEALSALKQTLDINPNDKDVNFRYAYLTNLLTPDNQSDILHYYRRSFTMGDTRYDSQFWYARALYIFNDIPKAKEIFDYLTSARVGIDEKREPRGVITVKNKSVEFSGTIIRKEQHFLIVKRDKIGDTIFINRFNVYKSWDNINISTVVYFNLAFNFMGPIAINVYVK